MRASQRTSAMRSLRDVARYRGGSGLGKMAPGYVTSTVPVDDSSAESPSYATRARPVRRARVPLRQGIARSRTSTSRSRLQAPSSFVMVNSPQWTSTRSSVSGWGELVDAEPRHAPEAPLMRGSSISSVPDERPCLGGVRTVCRRRRRSRPPGRRSSRLGPGESCRERRQRDLGRRCPAPRPRPPSLPACPWRGW